MLGEAPLLLDTSVPFTQILAAYIEQRSPLNATTDGRVVDCGYDGGHPLCAG